MPLRVHVTLTAGAAGGKSHLANALANFLDGYNIPVDYRIESMLTADSIPRLEVAKTNGVRKG